MTPDSAVLIPIIEVNGKEHILFEKRAEDIDFQPGDVCFPGGGIDPGEIPRDTVIREVCEELLITPDKISELKEFDVRQGPYTRVVSTFTGRISDYGFTYSKNESGSVFSVPLDEFPEPETNGSYYPVYNYKGYRIWGFTARLVRDFLQSRCN